MGLFVSITIGHDLHDLFAHHHVHEYECTAHNEESHFHEECSDCEMCPFCQLPTRNFEASTIGIALVIPETDVIDHKNEHEAILTVQLRSANSSRAPPTLL